MENQELLLRLSENLDAPIQVSAAGGATRSMAEPVEEARLDSTAVKGSPGSCTSWCGWGN